MPLLFECESINVQLPFPTDDKPSLTPTTEGDSRQLLCQYYPLKAQPTLTHQTNRQPTPRTLSLVTASASCASDRACCAARSSCRASASTAASSSCSSCGGDTNDSHTTAAADAPVAAVAAAEAAHACHSSLVGHARVSGAVGAPVCAAFQTPPPCGTPTNGSLVMETVCVREFQFQ